MSDFMEMMADMLPIRSAIHKKDNELYKVLDKSMGEYMDNVALDFNNLFLDTATGGWLDAFGKDYGVPRKLGESDEDYRNRIIFEKLEYLTAHNLQEIYGLTLYAYVSRFNAHTNRLTSDNPYTSNKYMALNDDLLKEILGNKFILGDSIRWIIEGEEFDYIIDIYDSDILDNYQDIYSLSSLFQYFQYNRNLKEVKLNLPSATDCGYMFRSCSGLTSVDLSLPSVVYCNFMFWYCRGLTSVDLSLPSATKCDNMLRECSGLINVDLNLPSATNCSNMLQWCTRLASVDLSLPSATNCSNMLQRCTSLTSVELDLPNATNCMFMFQSCTGLTSVKLNIPYLTSYDYMLNVCPNLETIEVTIPDNLVTEFKNYIQNLHLSNLTSLIINGEEYVNQ